MPEKEFLLRLPDALWDEIQAWAAEEVRSVNGRIEYLLRRAVNNRRRATKRPPLDHGVPE